MFFTLFLRLSGAIVVLQVLIIFLLITLGGDYISTPEGVAHKSDIIVILGGGTGERIKKGIELYKLGFSDKLLVTGFPDLNADVMPTYIKWRVRFIVESGVPESAIIIDGSARSSMEEAELIRHFLIAKKLRSALIVSDPPHIRRLSYIFTNELTKNSDFSYCLIASNPPWWDKNKWWNNKYSTQFLLLELVKIINFFIDKQ